MGPMSEEQGTPRREHNTHATLAACGKRLREQVSRQKAASGDSLLVSIEIGREIEEARKVIGSGGALYAWTEREADVKQRQAKTYVALFKKQADLRAAVAWTREQGVKVEPKLLRLENFGRLIAAHRSWLSGSPLDDTLMPKPRPTHQRRKKIETLLTFAAHQQRIDTLEAVLRDEGLSLPDEDAESVRRREVARAAVLDLPIIMAEDEHTEALKPSPEGEVEGNFSYADAAGGLSKGHTKRGERTITPKGLVENEFVPSPAATAGEMIVLEPKGARTLVEAVGRREQAVVILGQPARAGDYVASVAPRGSRKGLQKAPGAAAGVQDGSEFGAPDALTPRCS